MGLFKKQHNMTCSFERAPVRRKQNGGGKASVEREARRQLSWLRGDSPVQWWQHFIALTLHQFPFGRGEGEGGSGVASRILAPWAGCWCQQPVDY